MPNDVINTITLGNTTYNIGGSGHTIEKSDGTDMTQRANLQFVDATITDDSTNDRTKIENVKTITNESELDNLPDGIYIGPTDEGLPFDAGDIPYDNTESDLTATDVQGAIDELDDIITTDETTIEGNPINFSTLSAQNVKSTIIDLEPIQDLHGYDKPWVGGAGKNLLPMTVDSIKVLNSSDTWTGNKCTRNGVEFILDTDADGNIISITINRVSSSSLNADLYIGNSYGSTAIFAQAGIYTFSIDNSNIRFFIGYGSWGANTYSSRTEELEDGIAWAIIRVAPEISVSNAKIHPIICLSTTSNPSVFEPYTNKASIFSRNQIGILGCGKNLFDGTYVNAYLENGSTWKSNANCRSAIVPVSGNTKYTIKKYGGNRFSICESDSLPVYNTAYNTLYNQDAGTEATVTTSNGMKYLLIYVDNSSTEPNMQVEVGQTATQYEPYTLSNSLTISLGQTVYGGQLDVENGVLVVDKIHKNLGDLAWGKTSTNQFYSVDVKDFKYIESGDYKYATFFISSDYKSTYNSSLSQNGEIVCFRRETYPSEPKERIFIRDDSKADMTTAEFKSAMDGVDFVYELATTTTISLTPHQISLLEGVNNISTTGDKITLTYRDGKMATLKDIKDSLESSKPVYSTVETVVGTYLNKPLYSKTYQIEFSSSNSYYFDVPSAMDIKFVFGGVYSTRFDFIPFGYGGSGGDMVQCYRFSDTQFRIQNAYYASRMYCDVTLQYTKSTD